MTRPAGTIRWAGWSSSMTKRGCWQTPAYDFKGNSLEQIRRTIADDALADGWLADWSAVDAEDALENNGLPDQ